MEINLKTMTFDEILPIWRNDLWPGRKSIIKDMSSMVFMGNFLDDDYDMTIYEKYKPTFWGIYSKNNLIGVNSGFRTEDTLYRSRGIWIDKKYRGLGLSSLLFQILFIQAKLENCNRIWSLPRKSALASYESMGFKKCSDWVDEGVEFGPNCYVLKYIERK